jgi:hypothetical protein
LSSFAPLRRPDAMKSGSSMKLWSTGEVVVWLDMLSRTSGYVGQAAPA